MLAQTLPGKFDYGRVDADHFFIAPAHLEHHAGEFRMIQIQRRAAHLNHQLWMSTIGEPDDDVAELDVGIKASEQGDQEHHRRENP